MHTPTNTIMEILGNYYFFHLYFNSFFDYIHVYEIYSIKIYFTNANSWKSFVRKLFTCFNVVFFIFVILNVCRRNGYANRIYDELRMYLLHKFPFFFSFIKMVEIASNLIVMPIVDSK